MMSRLGLLMAALISSHSFASAEPAAPPPQLSTAAERVYEFAKPRILQIRSLLQSTGRQSTLGSGFLVTSEGLAITNYHVVSQYALDPKTYRLEFLAPDGSKGALTLLAFDVAHDLAVVKVDRKDLPYFEFDPRALAGQPAQGRAHLRHGQPARPRVHDRRGHVQRPRGQELRRAHPLLRRHQSGNERWTRRGW